jgi:hypothetical protein
MMKDQDTHFWNVIAKMNFNGRGYKEAGRWLVEDSGLTFSQIKQIHKTAVRKHNVLYNKLNAARIGSDDGFDDVLWQTIANGYEAFHNTTVEDLESMYNEMRYTESFAYAFHAVTDIEDEQFAANQFLKRERAMKRLEEIRRYGGGFQQKLLAAFEHADSNNRRKLAKGFPELFEHLVD